MALLSYRIVYLQKRKLMRLLPGGVLEYLLPRMKKDARRGLCTHVGWVLLICKNSAFSTFNLVANISRKKKLSLLAEYVGFFCQFKI